MTVALGLVCLDGVLVASDSMATGQGFASTSIIVRTFKRIPAIWTAAGSVFVMEEVASSVGPGHRGRGWVSSRASGDLHDAEFAHDQKRLRDNINPVMRKAYAKALDLGPPENGRLAISCPAEFLFLGYANATAWFLELAADGQANRHTEPGFYAVGTGGPFATVARALMEHYTLGDLTLAMVKRLAYREIDTTIRSSPSGVAGPVQIAVCDADGARVIGDEEIADLKAAVEGWKTLERETLHEAVQPSESTSLAADSEIPSLDRD